MLLSAFKQTLSELDTLKFQLPNGQFVPAHFHITEVVNTIAINKQRQVFTYFISSLFHSW